MWLSKVLVNFLLYDMNSPEPQTRLFSSSPWSVLTLKDWSTHCNTPDERGSAWWAVCDVKTFTLEQEPGWEPENLWCGLSVFGGLSCGHGTKFNKGQIGVNYKVVDLMQEKIPTKLCKYNGITWSTNFFCYGSEKSSAFGWVSEEWCTQKGFRSCELSGVFHPEKLGIYYFTYFSE